MDTKRKGVNLNVKQDVEFNENFESGISVARDCEEYGHLDLTDIRQYRTPLPPNMPLNLEYIYMPSLLTFG
jgi:hypothetical protein